MNLIICEPKEIYGKWDFQYEGYVINETIKQTCVFFDPMTFVLSRIRHLVCKKFQSLCTLINLVHDYMIV